MGISPRPRRQLKTIQRRIDWLKMRLDRSERDAKNKPWDASELNALEWAIGLLGPMFPAKEVVNVQANNADSV